MIAFIFVLSEMLGCLRFLGNFHFMRYSSNIITFPCQGATSPKNGVEVRLKSFGAVIFSPATFYDVVAETHEDK